MKQHTLGPWRVERQNPSPTSGEWMIAGAKPGYLAEVRDCGSGDVSANARLIAAAPELLEALLTCSNGTWQGGPYQRFDAELVRAAIAKATGGAA
jgi:hypothetical protein